LDLTVSVKLLESLAPVLSVISTEITVVPAEMADIVPYILISATDVLLLLYVLVSTTAPLGPTDSIKYLVVPTNIGSVALFEKLIYVAATGAVTFNVAVASFFVPSDAVTVTLIVVVPAPFAIALPLESIVATPVLDDDHSTFWTVAVDGDSWTLNVDKSPYLIVLMGLLMDTEFNATIGGATLIVIVVDIGFPLTVKLSDIRALPLPIARTFPF